MNIIIGKTAGFCYGVKRAVDGSIEQINNKNKIYCLGELVHNKKVVDDLQERGITFVNNIEEIKEKNSKVILRAHGVKKEIYNEFENKNINIVDFTCPNVLRIHDIAKEYTEKEFYIFVIGSKSHPEVEGTISYCGDNSIIIENENDVKNAINELENSKLNNLLVIVQTTYSSKKFEIIKDIILKSVNKNVNTIIKNTICLATEQRQKETEKLSKEVELMIIIGGKNSSNTKKLYEISKINCKNAICVESAKDLDIIKIQNFKEIGIMAGASTPQNSIDEVINKIKI